MRMRSASPGIAPSTYTGPVIVCGPRPGWAFLRRVISSTGTPGSTWFMEAIMVSITSVSPERMRARGVSDWSNQPHCTVSSVAGSR